MNHTVMFLEEAIENAEVREREDENISDDEQVNTVSNMDKYALLIQIDMIV